MKRFIVLLLFTLLVQSLFSEDKYVHFSIDDVNPVFKDLTLNKDKYNNLFDHDFFGFLKELNEKYGTKVTLYCFYSLNGFNISDCTDKFKNDFAENSKWLKIRYHSFSENYTFVRGGYKMFCNSVRKITGSTDCISQTVRLERFMANYEDIKISSYPSEEYGIKVLLTADSETRKSYFLDDKEILVLNKNESYRDEINNLSFYKTDFRFDDYKSYKYLFMQNKDENEIICFTHEWILQFPIRKNLIKYCMQQYRCSRIKKNIVSFMNYCKDNNYTFVTDF